jgi:hypothetical protein
MIRLKLCTICAAFFLLSQVIFAQKNPAITAQPPQNTPAEGEKAIDDPAALIGATLNGLFTGLGAPKSVYPVRGLAVWQDDVVFVYDDGEFFIYGNRVWQIKVRSAYGIKEGDPKAQAVLALGQGRDFEGHCLYPLPSKVWPITLRINWDASERIQAIYIYRSDF